MLYLQLDWVTCPTSLIYILFRDAVDHVRLRRQMREKFLQITDVVDMVQLVRRLQSRGCLFDVIDGA